MNTKAKGMQYAELSWIFCDRMLGHTINPSTNCNSKFILKISNSQEKDSPLHSTLTVRKGKIKKM